MGEEHIDWNRLSIVPSDGDVAGRQHSVDHGTVADDEQRQEPALPDVLRSLEDAKCRTILTRLGTPKSATELCETCDMSRSTVYRKLELLREAALVREYTEVRRDGPNSTLYERDVTNISIGIDDNDEFELVVDRPKERPEDRIATFWSEMKRES